MAMFYAPISVTICFGLSLATLLVLIVVPALILLLEELKTRLLQHAGRFTRHFKAPQDTAEESHASQS